MPGGEATGAPQAIPKWLPGFLHRFIGNGHLVASLKPLGLRYPIVASANSVYNVAPASKWALSVVPAVGAITGSVPPEKVSLNMSASLALTGFIWTVYAMMISPQNAGSRSLAAVNLAMGVVNGYNAYRRWNYDKHSTSRDSA